MRPESRKSLLAKVHIAKKDLGLDDDTYRLMLENLTGTDSAAKLTVPQLARVVADLRKQGWQGQPRKPARRKPVVASEAAAYIDKIEALLAEAKRPWTYAATMAKRMYRVDTLEWLSPEQARGIMLALVRDAERHGRATA